MKPLLSDDKADVGAVGTAVAILVAIFIAVLVVYSIAGALDVGDLDLQIARDTLADISDYSTGGGENATGPYYNMSYASNSTVDVLDQSGTFFTIAPLIVVVLVAVIILGYVIQLGGRRR